MEKQDRLFPEDAQARKEVPVLSGFLLYFPRACAAVAAHSLRANEQHNPGEPMHWAEEKSIGDGNEIVRHTMEALFLFNRQGRSDGVYDALAATAWRALELLERYLRWIEPFDSSGEENACTPVTHN